jgi:phage terminase large subunit|tara:strand:- start:8709 stop:10037 length:1329 start_codon:yes stop_codon:yes gene_type:complete
MSKVAVVEEEVVKQEIELPPKLVPVFEGEARIRASYGSRGSGKTRSFALMSAVFGYRWGSSGISGTILCGREFMNSLTESSLEEIKAAIRSIPWLEDYYEIGDKYIKSHDGRITYTFAGLRRSLDSIKSKSRILLAWVDEAENVSGRAWDVLLPSIREEDKSVGFSSEVWVTWNPESKYSATHERFRASFPSNCKIVQLNYTDNPWFPKVLDDQRIEDKEKRPDMYEHIWEGGFLVYSEGSYYSSEMRRAKDEDRIGKVRYDRAKGVVTSWDLGIGDSTSIVFSQFIGTEIHIIDYYEASGAGLEHYAKVLQDKGYVYDQHVFPHDVRVRELGTGKSRIETLESLGIRDIEIAPSLLIDDGIQKVREMLDKCFFDETKCEKLIDALLNYSRDWDDNGKTWRMRPRHDWSSHAADSMRYLAIGYTPYNESWDKPIRRNLQGIV